MVTFQKFLIVLGLFVFAYNASTIVHELGHALNVTATGGEVDRITVSPFSWSYTYYNSINEPIAVSWGGFLWETIFGLSFFMILWMIKSRLSLIGVFMVIACLGGTALYMLAGVFFEMGDSDDLISLGTPPIALIITGFCLLLLVLPFVIPIGQLLNIGKGKCRLCTTNLIFSPILFYLIAMAVFNLLENYDEWPMWLGTTGGGAVLTLLVASLVHWASPWGGPETRSRAFPVNWWTCMLSIALAAGVVVVELLVFA